MPPESAGVIVGAVQREPREGPFLDSAATPLRNEGGLTEARRGVNEDQPGSSARQGLNQRPPLHPLLTRTGSMKLRLDGHINARAARMGAGDRPDYVSWSMLAHTFIITHCQTGP